MKDGNDTLVVLVVLLGVGVVVWMLVKRNQVEPPAQPKQPSLCESAVGTASAVGSKIASKGAVSADNAKVDSFVCGLLNSVGAKLTQVGKGVAQVPTVGWHMASNATTSIASGANSVVSGIKHLF